MKQISRISLIRRKSLFFTSGVAWKDIASKTKIKPSQVKPNHSKLAWIWLPKINSGIIFSKSTKKSIKKTKNKIISNKKIVNTTWIALPSKFRKYLIDELGYTADKWNFQTSNDESIDLLEVFRIENSFKKQKKFKSKSKKVKSKSKSKNTVKVTTNRKDFDMCKKIDDALKNKNVKEIIIKK